MRITRIIPIGLVMLAMIAGWRQPASGADTPPSIAAFNKPAAGEMEIIFHGQTGPFTVQTRSALDANAPWVDMPSALVTELNTGVFMALVPTPKDPVDIGFYRIMSAGDTVAELKGWTILLNVSTPANGTHFVQGESAVISVTIADTFAQGITRDSLSTFNLYMDGPEDPLKTVAAVKLLNVTTDRTKTPHHVISLKTSPGVVVNGNTLTYTLQPVTDEAPGTYTIGVRATLAADLIQGVVKFAKVQIGTSVKESPLVERVLTNGTTQITCAACHFGPVSGKMYLAHIDPSSTPGSVGDWPRDLEPVKSCKMCHNNEGNASFIDPSTLGTAVTNRISDHIVRRVHGIHMGSGLSNFWNTNQANGVFKAYTTVEFPAETKNCTKCHVDDRWQTQPSRLACGTCHDNLWFGPKPTPADRDVHAGGPQADDSKCAVCHPAVTDPNGFDSIAVSHNIDTPPLNAVDVTLSAPANQKFYVAGEKPVVSLVFKNDAGNSIGDHTTVDSAHFSSASLFVYGPRSMTQPVLTSMARLGVETKRPSVSCTIAGPWNINGKTLKIGINGSGPKDIAITGAGAAVTPAEVVASLNAVITNYNAKATVSGTSLVNIASLIRGAAARIEIYNGEVTTAMGWKAPGVVLEPDVTVAAVSTAANDLRPVTNPLDFNDPQVTRTTTNIQYLLDDVKGLAPGTYCVFVYHTPKAPSAGLNNWAGLGFTTFQVGTATAEKKIAGNCLDCHSSTPLHLYEKIGEPAMSAHVHPAQFDVDQCKACHDYGHPNSGDMFKNQGGTSLNGWSGYGAMPIARRVHGVHFAHYLEHSEEIYANATKDTFGDIIFPQDVRNCTKCHAESDTWKQKPSRITCLACHDSDAAKAHGTLMTYIPDPTDPYGPLAQESCEVCHGAGAEFSPEKVHSISKPYVPPYPRDP